MPYYNAGNGLDTTEDACQGDSGGPLVGYFHDQIKPLELFPKASGDTNELENIETLETESSISHSKATENENIVPTENHVADIDPNSMRLENFIKLDLTPKRKILDKFLAKADIFPGENVNDDIIRSIELGTGKDGKERISRDVSQNQRNKHKTNRNLIWLNSVPKPQKSLKPNSKSKRSLNDIKDGSKKSLKYINLAGNQNRKSHDHDNEEYIFRRFNFHQPAEGELSDTSTEYNNNYRVSDSKMNAFLDRVHKALRSKKAELNSLAPVEKLSQRQNSRLMDLKSSSENKKLDSRNVRINDIKKRKNLGRFLWSVPNNDTRIAIESMINAGIQASILSALEHFKELQEQQNKFFQQQKV